MLSIFLSIRSRVLSSKSNANGPFYRVWIHLLVPNSLLFLATMSGRGKELLDLSYSESEFYCEHNSDEEFFSKRMQESLDNDDCREDYYGKKLRIHKILLVICKY